MSQFTPITAAQAVTLVKNNITGFEVASPMIAKEISDGNMNIVYRVLDRASQRSVIVKQAPPYIRVIGESWPLTQQRIAIEANALRYFKQYSANAVVDVLYFAEDLASIIMEDLSDCILWRQALINDSLFADKAKQIGSCMADLYFPSSHFCLDATQQRQLQAQFYSPAMCATTATVFFDDPYYDCERNNIHPELKQVAEQLWQDAPLKTKVGQLKHKFFHQGEALLHGDFHTGSVLVSATQCKLIDAEFAFVGPIGFDIGSTIANLLLNYCCKLEHNPKAAQTRIGYIYTLWQTFNEQFSRLASNGENDEQVTAFLSGAWHDALGYAGTEMIRRTIGVAQVEDFNLALSEPELVRAKKLALKFGQWLLSDAVSCITASELCQEIEKQRLA